MNTLIEQSPEYPAKVAEYLAKTDRRALPWGTLVAGGHLTMTKTYAETQARHEMGEAAIALLNALGVTNEMIDALVGLPADALLQRLEELRTSAPGEAGAPTDSPHDPNKETTL